MPSARIYRPTKDASQSGMARTKQWVLVFDQTKPRETDPLMGWYGSSDMMQQVRLEFDTKEEAVAYAQREGITYRVEEPGKETTRKGCPTRTTSSSTVPRLGRTEGRLRDDAEPSRFVSGLLPRLPGRVGRRPVRP